MSSKLLIIIIVVFSLTVIVGSYFLVSGGNKSAAKIVSYTRAQAERPKAEAKTAFSDIGEMKVSDQKSADFAIKNTGKKPLQLFSVTTSCNCTFAKIVYKGRESEEFSMHSQGDFVEEVAPGSEAKIQIIYRPYIMPVYGVVEREVYVSTNDPDNPRITLKMRAFVK